MKFFTIDKEYYKPFSLSAKNTHYITFRYMLPFRLPLKSSDAFIIENTMFVPLHKQYEHYGLKDGMAKLPLKRTVIEATVKISKKTKRNLIKEDKSTRENKRSKELSMVFDKQLEKLNEFIEIIIMKHKVLPLSTVHRGEVIGFAFYRMYDYREEKFFSIRETGMLMLFNNLEVESGDYATLTNREVKDITYNYNALKNHPYKGIILTARAGERAFHYFDYNLTIVEFNTMFELLISSIVRDYYLMMNLKTKEKVNNIISDNGIKHIAKQHLYNILGELSIINRNEVKNLIESYFKKEYLYRNDIVHEGKNFGEDEAYFTMHKVKDLAFLLNHGINNAAPNSFVNHYNRFNRNSFPHKYEEKVKKYRTDSIL